MHSVLRGSEKRSELGGRKPRTKSGSAAARLDPQVADRRVLGLAMAFDASSTASNTSAALASSAGSTGPSCT
jgi:hypothetical protein